jgi:hypothetical protein
MIPEIHLQPRGALRLSAASGLVLRDGVLHVIGDDRTGLDRYRLDDGTELPALPLLPDAPPLLPKPQKPDLEALALLADGSLLALGSGSRRTRDRGFRIEGDRVRTLDLSPLYTALRARIEDLNIEGACLYRGRLLLAHRGVKDGRSSRLIGVDPRVLAPECSSWDARALLSIEPLALGELDGVALSVTDLATDAEGLLHYLAAAEDTREAYLDGGCRGSVIGCIGADGQARHLARLRPDVKAEGLAFVSADANAQQWRVVTDADDPARAAMLYALELPRNAH